jgi:hypothetical protein
MILFAEKPVHQRIKNIHDKVGVDRRIVQNVVHQHYK